MVKVIKKAFVVIGKVGSTLDGEGFIQKLWNDANSHFNEVAHLAKKDANGNLVGIWGAMSDMSHSFKPWKMAFVKDYIWQEWNVLIMQKHLMDGQNGSYLVISI